jgi:phosphoglycerate kinase
MDFLKLQDMDVEGKRILLRVDFNVPIKNGVVEDDSRLKAAVPTINHLLEKNCKIILISHLGRPQKLLKEGIPSNEIKKNLSLKPVSDELSEILGVEVSFVDDCIGIEIPNCDLVMLENLRFHKEEEKNDDIFAQKLASYADIFVNDAFGASHRDHASVSAITKILPSCAGFLLNKEIKELTKVLEPKRPFVAIVAGSKPDKIGALKSLGTFSDKILVGGVLANTLLKAKGIDIGISKFDEEAFNAAAEIIKMSNIKLPIDFVVGDSLENNTLTEIRKIDDIPKDRMNLDIGPETIISYKEELEKACTIFWAGPLGVFEIDKFANGTRAIGDFIVSLDAVKIVGGGDTISALNKFNLADKMTYISTGGGASLEFIEKKGKLPALIALEQSYVKV